ncbi:polyisoprenoid-binding protein YceI [Chitinophaga niastensis]|uniref:Polyisoprenoid-binding protein YceI n=1 Tax=Chitinophaga niastensis TaxID=536980 RepID=A0A2P8HGS2_CHINA|nr:YceI family protein [Chitinophaga niastensis]PSL45390.1 polyisoprenoid-binding protein YceI [Chitinophaga niastensis]
MMKTTSIIASLLILSATTFAQSWTVDKVHSRLGYGVTHMGISESEGSFKDYTAKITSSKEDFSDAVVELTANVASINTENEQRDGHLKSPDFFDAAKYPTLTFKSTSFKKVGDKQYKVTGDLTLHGVTKPVTLDVVLNGTTTNPMSKKTVAGFKITGTIKRADFGVAAGMPTAMLGDEVAIRANTEFIKD